MISKRVEVNLIYLLNPFSGTLSLGWPKNYLYCFSYSFVLLELKKWFGSEKKFQMPVCNYATSSDKGSTNDKKLKLRVVYF